VNAAASRATVTIDKAGRIVLPKPIRDALQLKPGSSLEIEQHDDAILLRPPRAAAVMIQKNGFWVFDTGGQITTEMVDNTLAGIREESEQRDLDK